MAVTKKIIGRIPICFGTWYAKQGGWGIKNRVTLYGSEFESLHENNTVPPAVYDDVENTVTFNENDWRVISNGTEAWLADAKIDALGTWEESPEFVEVTISENGFILYGVQKDGNVIFGNIIPKDIQNALNKIAKDIDDNFGDIRGTFHYETSPEYIFACIDNKDKFLYGVTVEGKFRAADLEFELPEEEAKWLNTIFSLIQDPEHLEITVDSEDKMLSWRDNKGVKHETNLNIEHSINLSNEAMSDFQQALKAAGFTPGGGGDWSDRKTIELPEPKHYALLNININSLPTNSGDVRDAVIEYYDGLGNSFKINANIEIQGQSSRIFAQTGGKGNYTLDLSTDVKFGNWVPQDSFHLKGAAKDVTRGILPTSYKWAYLMQEFLGSSPNRVLIEESEITSTSATGKRINDWPTDARCLPDGFPCEVYVNGEYHGLFSWQLKKHRKNYSMDKKDYTSFFIDADAIMTDDYQHGIWNDGPDDRTYRSSSWWTGFDIKGPKDLICMDGSEFDGDNPKELIDPTSSYYDSSNKKHKGSYTTKTLIRSMSTRYNEVKEYINNSDIATAKEKFNEYFDYDACMLVYIYNSLMYNTDSIKKNTLWGMYNSGKIFPMLWDLDNMYGENHSGAVCVSPNTGIWNIYRNAAWPLALFWTLYETEIKATYSALRDAKIISVETWHDIVFNQWVNRIGEEAYNRDIKKWPETPSYRENYTDTENWVQLGWRNNISSTPIWNETTSYSVNDEVALPSYAGTTEGVVYKAKTNNVGKCPVTDFYNTYPVVGGYYDSPKRWEKWISEQIELCDQFVGYTE